MESKTFKKLFFLFISALFLCFLLLSWQVYQLVQQPLLEANSQPKIIVLDRSASAHQLVSILKQNNLIKSSKLLLGVIKYKNLAHQLKAGVYQLKVGESAVQFLERVAKGDVLVLSFPIIAGTTQAKISQDLLHAPYLRYQDTDWASIMGGHPKAEGLILADTYQYHGGSSSARLLDQAHKNLMTYLNTSWDNRATELPYRNAYELLIAASIIEKETAIPAERKLIAGVMVNRLKKYMPLQMDPTVIYGLGADYRGKLSHNDLLIDSPYNSYKYRGLPPTPISTVGKEAIDAAAHPQLSQYLYFVAKGDGSHQFSETYEQQRQAINRYQRKDL